MSWTRRRSPVTAMFGSGARRPGMTVTQSAVHASVNPDTAFTALNNAFLVSSGTQRHCKKESLSKTTKDYFWRQALDSEAAGDYAAAVANQKWRQG